MNVWIPIKNHTAAAYSCMILYSEGLKRSKKYGKWVTKELQQLQLRPNERQTF